MITANPRRILFVSHTARHGGAEHMLLELISGLDRREFEPIVVLPLDGPLKNAVEALGVRTHIVPLEWWFRGKGYAGLPGSNVSHRVHRLKKLIERERIDQVHTNTSAVWEGALAARLARRPHIWHIHEHLPQHPGLVPLLPLPLALAVMEILSDRFVVPSRWVAGQFPEHLLKGRLSIAPNGIDINRFKAGRPGGVRRELGLADDVRLFATIGAVEPGKGHDNLLKAVTLIREQSMASNLRFVIIGGGNPETIARLRHELTFCGDLVRYLGERQDIPDILAACDGLIMPSQAEAFSLVVVEAMAAGKPVIATRCGGPDEIIADGITGILVPVDDSAALAHAILTLAADCVVMRTMGERAAKVAAEQFSAAVFVDRFARLYRELGDAPLPEPLTAEDLVVMEGLMASYQRLSSRCFRAAAVSYVILQLRALLGYPLRSLGTLIADRVRQKNNS